MSNSGNYSSGTDHSAFASLGDPSSTGSSIMRKSVSPQLQLSLPISWISPSGHCLAAYAAPQCTHSAKARDTSSLWAIIDTSQKKYTAISLSKVIGSIYRLLYADAGQKTTSQTWPQLPHSNVVCNPSSITSRLITVQGENRHSGQDTSIVVLERFPTEVRRTLCQIGQFCSLRTGTKHSEGNQ